MKQNHFLIASLLVGCAADGSERNDAGDDGISASISVDGTAPTSVATEGDPTGGDSGPGDGTAASADDGLPPPKYDVGIESYCQIHGGGIHCDDQNTAIECTEDGGTVDSENCNPDLCLPGTGCVVCLAGQYTCMGDKVMSCNAAAVPPAWQLVEVCNPGAGEGCNLELGTCEVLQPVGSMTPTGEYYQFAEFATGNVFLGGYDVDSYEDRIYVLGNSLAIQVYEVELLDTDADGELEPNQHPNNPDNPGAIEQRVLTFIETLPQFGTPAQSVSEIYAASDRVYLAGSQLTEYVFAGGATQVISSPPGWASSFSHVGFDDVHSVWYASNEGARRVFQYDSAGASWGIAFLYPELSGDHMDGMEVVTDPNTGTVYVYVSDMTSDFIGQYRLDSELGWVQENLFSYSGTAGSLLEGMGYGALYHFWATSGNTLYEIGGGDLAEFTEPPG